ncbi:MAG: HAD family phosphatase [Deltaproteobacteria bacterium]|nr:HAD family phosphatase [Deltaproteobacteria bacterium]
MRISEQFVAVIFDVDGVLIDTMGYHADAWVRAGQELGVEVDEEEVYRREGEPGLKTAKDFMRIAGMMSTKARARAFVGKKEEVYQQIAAQPRVFPNATQLLDALEQCGMLLAFVTGTSREEIRRTLPPVFEPYFKTSVCGDEVMRGKPNPEPYMAAMRTLGTNPRETLVIENAPYGIRSGKNRRRDRLGDP